MTTCPDQQKRPLSITHPEIAAQWHSSRNLLRPQLVTAGSNRKVWWQDSLGHEWETTPANRVRGTGCPYCASRSVLAGFNDLGTKRPDIAAEWLPMSNGDRTPTNTMVSSGRKVWWRGACGHEWEAPPAARVRGSGCPYCASRSVLAGFNDLATKRPDIAAEWHPTSNGDRTPTNTMASSNKKYWFRCVLGHDWQMTLLNRTHGGQGCPVCAGQTVLRGFNDMATTAPELAIQWHPTRNAPLNPTDVFRSTARRFWWQDSLGHEWQASANERANGSGCPFCSGQRVLTGFNDLTTRYPEIADEWSWEKNAERRPDTITSRNGFKAWWTCSRCGYDWRTTVASRTAGNGCPACARKVVVPGINDLTSVRPDIAADWHPSKNPGVTPDQISVYSNKKAWFVCRQGHEWASTVNNRSNGQGCPGCAETGFHPGRAGYLYFLAHDRLGAWKVGITNIGTNRLAGFQRAGWEVLNLELFDIGADARKIELEILAWWRDELHAPPALTILDMPSTSGWSETISQEAVSVKDCIAMIKEKRRSLLFANETTIEI